MDKKSRKICEKNGEYLQKSPESEEENACRKELRGFAEINNLSSEKKEQTAPKSERFAKRDKKGTHREKLSSEKLLGNF